MEIKTPPCFKESTNSEHEQHGTENTQYNQGVGGREPLFQVLQRRKQHL